jgi:hypothetical protein
MMRQKLEQLRLQQSLADEHGAASDAIAMP